MRSFFSKNWERIQIWLRTTKTRLFRSDFKKLESKEKHPLLLCVDDDPDFCTYLQRLAKKLGIKLDKAYSIKEAKRKIEREDFRGFIIDGHFPNESGFELVSWIRKEKGLKAPIAFLSRIYQDAASFRLLKEKLKVNFVLDKPLNPSEAGRLLQQLSSFQESDLIEEIISDELLVDLTVIYQKSIPDKLERLEKMILTLQKDPSVAHLKELKTEVHKIAGSAGSYGYVYVSQLCKDWEKELLNQIDRAQAGQYDPLFLDSLDAFFKQIKIHFQI